MSVGAVMGAFSLFALLAAIFVLGVETYMRERDP